MGLARPVVRWLDSWAPDDRPPAQPHRVDVLRVVPLMALHVACLGVLWVGWSTTALAVAAGLYGVRMFAITGFYHRYFSHRAFALTRRGQLVAAILGGSAVQRGPLWWAAHHRHHHRHTELPEDPHSPRQHGFWWSHVLWLTSRENFAVRLERVPDLAGYPELRWLDRFDVAVPVALAALTYLTGEILAACAPSLGTDGMQLLIWGFAVSTVVLLHATCTINSLAHRPPRRARFDTGDDSRNSLWLALLTFGEGWHNNHHRYPGAARQGFAWWEIDVTYYVLLLLERLGIVRELRPVPAALLETARSR
jgi:stearoyl-CoA desaturase (delta-9 desaturase)